MHVQLFHRPSRPLSMLAHTRAHTHCEGGQSTWIYFCISSSRARSGEAGFNSPSPTSSHTLAPESLSQDAGAGHGNEPRKDFFITFLNVLLIASSVADVACLMMQRQEQPRSLNELLISKYIQGKRSELNLAPLLPQLFEWRSGRRVSAKETWQRQRRAGRRRWGRLQGGHPQHPPLPRDQAAQLSFPQEGLRASSQGAFRGSGDNSDKTCTSHPSFLLGFPSKCGEHPLRRAFLPNLIPCTTHL